jgi:hypothetical protein
MDHLSRSWLDEKHVPKERFHVYHEWRKSLFEVAVLIIEVERVSWKNSKSLSLGQVQG